MKEQLLFAASLLGDPKDLNISSQAADHAALGGFLNLVYVIAAVIAVIVIIIAGMMYVTSSGDANNIAKAKNMIIYSVVGLIIVILAFAITNFVIGRF